MDGTAAGAAELADRIAVLHQNAAKTLARRRDYARWAMEWGRYADAVNYWKQYLGLCPDDLQACYLAVIACTSAGISPDDNLPKGLARLPDHPVMK